MAHIINDIYTNLAFIEGRQRDDLSFSEKMLLNNAWDAVIRNLEQLEALIVRPRITIAPPPPPANVLDEFADRPPPAGGGWDGPPQSPRALAENFRTAPPPRRMNETMPR